MTTIAVQETKARGTTPRVTQSTTETIFAPAQAVFSVATALETLPKAFQGYGPVPGIRRAWMKDGGPLRDGGIRVVETTDGHITEEEIVILIRPLRLQYRITGFRSSFGLLVSGAVSDWAFTQKSDGTTRVTWRTTFETRSRFAYPIASLIARFFFARVQAECLKAIKAMVECHGCPVPGDKGNGDFTE